MTAKRSAVLQGLGTSPEVSVLIIGAGVNGIGTFRDLAHQGVDVLLVDKADFSSGASATSSHMLHGGIRYLENGEFRLVSEALTERNLMLHNAPHYAKPLPTAIPIFSLFSGFFNAPLKFLGLREKPTERGLAVIKIGLIFYDWFARKFRVMPTHNVLGRAQALKQYPGINSEVVAVARYYDAWMPYPERICLEMIQDAEAVNSAARALNYVSVTGASGDTVTLQDELTGQTVSVKPKIVINAAGPWIDLAMRAMGKETRWIGGTKGSHLILDHPELYAACNGGEMFFENDDGRIVLILPFLEGKVMVGTTDIRIDDPDQVVCTPEETEYMLALVRKVFPNIQVRAEQIVFNFCGVRPLPASEKGFTGNVSRDHSIRITEPDDALHFPTLSLIGGKWTSYRALSEQTADKTLARLNKSRKLSTASLKIGGGVDYPADSAAWIASLASETGIEPERAHILFERYGTTARAIARFVADGDDAPLATKPNYTRREVLYLALNERIEHLDDLILRRTLMAWLGGFTAQTLAEVADIVAEALNWDSAQKQAEIARTLGILSRRHGLNL